MWRVVDGRPRVVALFDWEMSTIGDPLADLGWMLTYWPDPTAARAIPAGMDGAAGFLTRPQMLARYEAASGRAMRHFAFYEAFAIFKLAIILEGSYARFVHGQADDPMFAELKERVPALAEAAWKLCEAARD
jgi:aminoglycoside phosphotransferase (APT) family kinase protein